MLMSRSHATVSTCKIKHTIKQKDKAKINYAFLLKEREMENTRFLGVARRYLLLLIFNIPDLLPLEK